MCEQVYESGGTGADSDISAWKKQIEQSLIVAKIVKVDTSEPNLLEDITRYTNSQTGVRSQDFLALVHGFRDYAHQMAERYDIYLETQRGGWDSRRAWQKQHPTAHRFTRWINAFDLLKVYGAGWYREVGEAQTRNATFSPPDGKLYKRILGDDQDGLHFGVDDLYASFLLLEVSKQHKFGHQSPINSRRLTKSLYYMTSMDLLLSILRREKMSSSIRALTRAVIRLLTPPNESVGQELLSRSVELIDEYFSDTSELSVYNEPLVQASKNPRTYMMLEKVGRDDEISPNYRTLFREYERYLFREGSGGLGQRVAEALRQSPRCE